MPDVHPLPGTDVIVDPGSGPVRLHVVCHGRSPAGSLPLLLLHGVPTGSYLWRDVARDLEHDHLCVMPDLVGLGASERPASRRPYALDAQAGLLLRLLDRLDLSRVAVAGHDLGGAVAVHLAALAPERVAGLVLVDAPLHADVWPVPAVLPLLTPGVGEAEVAALRRLPAVARAVLSRALGARVAPRELAAYLEPLLAPDGGPALLRLVRAVDLAAVEAALALVAAAAPPSLVLWGEHDELHRTSYGRRVAAALPGSSWVPVADAGHLLPQERPERVAEEIAAFLADLPAASTG